MRSGLAAEFTSAGALVAAAARLRALGYRELDAFTPHPVHGLDEALALGRSRLNWIVFPLGMGGAIGGFFIMWYCNAWSYAINVGGRPPFAIPAFIPITFESGVLAAAVSAFVILLGAIGLPRLAHPLFQVDGFERATVDRFWLAVGDKDPRLELARTANELRAMGAARVAPFGRLAQ
jgi:Alternative complex III, ActD subunit